MTRHNPQLIHEHRSYTVKEIVLLLGVDKRTCFRWIQNGLAILPGPKKPILILGAVLKTFIRTHNSKKKVTLKRHEFYCLRCKAPRRAKRGTIYRSGYEKRAECSVCNGKMSRTIKPYQKDYSISPTPVQMSLLSDNLSL
jgi:transposase-like protein